MVLQIVLVHLRYDQQPELEPSYAVMLLPALFIIVIHAVANVYHAFRPYSMAFMYLWGTDSNIKLASVCISSAASLCYVIIVYTTVFDIDFV